MERAQEADEVGNKERGERGEAADRRERDKQAANREEAGEGSPLSRCNGTANNGALKVSKKKNPPRTTTKKNSERGC